MTKRRHSSEEQDAAHLFKAVGEKTRLHIIKLCFENEKSVNELLNKTGLEKTLLSKHLKVLRDAGVLLPLKKGRHVSYTINQTLRHTKHKNTLSLHCCNIELK